MGGPGTVERPGRVEGFGNVVMTLVATQKVVKVSPAATSAETPPRRDDEKMAVPVTAKKAVEASLAAVDTPWES